MNALVSRRLRVPDKKKWRGTVGVRKRFFITIVKAEEELRNGENFSYRFRISGSQTLMNI
jgi:hypothetical protein